MIGDDVLSDTYFPHLYHLFTRSVIVLQTNLYTIFDYLNLLWNDAQISSAAYMAVCYRLISASIEDYQNICILSYCHYRMRNINHWPLFMVRSWYNGTHSRAMLLYLSFCVTNYLNHTVIGRFISKKFGNIFDTRPYVRIVSDKRSPEIKTSISSSIRTHIWVYLIRPGSSTWISNHKFIYFV